MASNRHLGRIVVLQTLYEYEFRSQAQDKTVDLAEIIFRNMKQYEEAIGDKQFVQDLLNGIIERQVELDTKLQPMAPEWPISQIARIDRNVLRMGLYELLYSRETVPPKVAINEAVELAKAFGSDNSSKFINGVLGTAYKLFVEHFRKYFHRTRRSSIQEIVREPTAGGVIFRRNQKNEVEILLIQDSKDRWTIPKGHIEEGETAQETAKREIGEEAGLHDVKIIGWLVKINFRYRRIDRLVLMTTQVFLVKALGDTDAIQKEDWMNGIRWFSFSDALDEIEYEDIGKLILLAMKKIRQENL